MALVQIGIDMAVIALSLGRKSAENTFTCLHADLKLKDQAMAKSNQETLQPVRNRHDDDLLASLDGLRLFRKSRSQLPAARQDFS